MSRFEQRLRQDMQNPEFAAGFREAETELAVIEALEEARKLRHLSKSELAARMGKQRESVSRMLSSKDSNPTLRTIIQVLTSLNMTAEITLRPAQVGEDPITIATVE